MEVGNAVIRYLRDQLVLFELVLAPVTGIVDICSIDSAGGARWWDCLLFLMKSEERGWSLMKWWEERSGGRRLCPHFLKRGKQHRDSSRNDTPIWIPRRPVCDSKYRRYLFLASWPYKFRNTSKLSFEKNQKNVKHNCQEGQGIGASRFEIDEIGTTILKLIDGM